MPLIVRGPCGGSPWSNARQVDLTALPAAELTGPGLWSSGDQDFESVSNTGGGNIWSVGDGNELQCDDATASCAISMSGLGLDDANAVFISVSVVETAPWLSQGGIQIGAAPDGGFDPGVDFLRINSLSHQLSRRGAGTSFASFGTPVPAVTSRVARGVMFTRTAVSLATQGVKVVDPDDLSAPDSGDWTFLDPGGVGINSRTWFFDGVNDRIVLWLNGNTGYRLAGYRVDTLSLGDGVLL